MDETSATTKEIFIAVWWELGSRRSLSTVFGLTIRFHTIIVCK